MAKEDARPRIKIVSDGLTHGEHTKVLTPDAEGNWVEIQQAITEIDLHMKAGAFNTATVKAILIGAEIDAVITDLQTKVLPPPQPKPKLRLWVGEPENVTRPNDPTLVWQQSHWKVERLNPLPTWGVSQELLAEGWMAPIGPLEIVADAE